MTRMHPDCVAQARIDTPLGPMLAAATPQGLAGLWFDAQAHHPGPLPVPTDPGQRWIAATRAWLQRYWEPSREYDGEPGARAQPLPALDLHGTPFQREVWQALCTIEPGRTLSYAAVAAAVGRPAAVRAVGAAIGRNPVSVLVPCHRVVGFDGQLTGYAGGLPRKQALLALEARFREAGQASLVA
jgi:methylated-DNA-[protein]-cysteine S-methyltransferase